MNLKESTKGMWEGLERGMERDKTFQLNYNLKKVRKIKINQKYSCISTSILAPTYWDLYY